MFKKSTIKTLGVLLMILVCAAFVLTACNNSNAFKPVSIPGKGEVSGNGGIAVRYGDYIYYVNGYQSDNTADNSYTSEIRVGSIVRIKIAELETIIGINDLDLSSTKKTEEIKKAVAGKSTVVKTDGAETVVPNFYYTGNSSNTSLNGLYIFDDRIYITTPNNDLDANGNVLNNQLLLKSYDLGGGDAKTLYTFESNAPQLKLSKAGNDLYATFILSDSLYSLKVGESEAKQISEKATSASFSDDYVYYLDGDGNICQFKVGATEATKIVSVPENDKSNTSYSIKSVNGEYVYYTVSNDSQTSGLKLYYATASNKGVIVLNALPTGSYYGWQNKVVYTASVPEESVLMYGIWSTSGNGAASDTTTILSPDQNGNSITFNKLEGNILHYTVNSLTYTLDLSDTSAKPVAYAYSLSTSSTGWATPDVLAFSWTHDGKTSDLSYVFSVSSGSVSVVRYDPATKKNTSSINLTLTVIEEDK